MKVHFDFKKVCKITFRFIGKAIWESLFFYSGCLRHLPRGWNVMFALWRIPLFALGLATLALGYWEVTGHASATGLIGFLAFSILVPIQWELYRSFVRVGYRLFYTQTVMRRNHFRYLQQSRR